MKTGILLACVGALCLSGCSKSGEDSPQDKGEKYTLDLAPEMMMVKAVDPGNENMMLASHMSVSVFASAAPTAALFLDSRYTVSDRAGVIGLSFNNGIPPATAKQKIIEVSAGTYDIYGVGVNDGLSPMVLDAGATEDMSTYVTTNGQEYLHGEAKGHVVTNEASSRQVKLTFERQVAMVAFSFVAGTSTTLPDASTTDLIVKTPLMRTPFRGAGATEGVMHLTSGITEPLSGGISAVLEPIYANGVGQALGMHYYVLPTDLGAAATTYDVQFTLRLDDGSGTLTDRVFDVENIPVPTITGGNRGFEKGKAYTYTITVSNTGLYISEVQVKSWIVDNQGDIIAQ